MARICNAAVGAKARFYVWVFVQLGTRFKFAELALLKRLAQRRRHCGVQLPRFGYRTA
jgi:hypothetical protein